MLHRIGGAVRRVFPGVTTPRTPRRPATPPDLTPAAQQASDSPTPPRRPRVPRRPPVTPSEGPPFAQSVALPVALPVAQPEASPKALPVASPDAQPRRGWFARWFGRRPRHVALPLPSHPPFPDNVSDSDNTPFTPENHPGLSPEVCDFFNTRIDDCDPEMLHIVLAVIATLVAESLPPELRTDPRAIVADIWDRLREPSDEVMVDAAPGEPAREAPDSLTEAAPDQQPGEVPANLTDTAPNGPAEEAPASLTKAAPDMPPSDTPAKPDDAMPEVSSPPPAALPEALMAVPPDSIAIAVAEDPRHPAAPPRPDRHSRTHHRNRGRVPDRTSRRQLRRCRPIRRLGRGDLPSCPPPRRLCYAACAGPP